MLWIPISLDTLKQYLERKRPHRGVVNGHTTTLCDILSLLKDIINTENLYDPRNLSIMLADEDLEQVLDVKAWKQLSSLGNLYLSRRKDLAWICPKISPIRST